MNSDIDMIYVHDVIKNKLLEIKETDGKWSIYGTGNGAEQVWKVIHAINCSGRIAYIFDNDAMANKKQTFHGYDISRIEDYIDQVNIVIVGAELNHYVITERLQKIIQKQNIKNIRVIDPFQYDYSSADIDAYLTYIGTYSVSDEFVPLCNDSYSRMEEDPKIIAWYLPQFHQMEINNKYHGQGFTEWTNTSRTLPQYIGHHQPHIPYDVGYYDLLNPDTLQRQIFLAKKYGIYGFGFFYFWYSGTKIMEKPIQMFLEHTELNMPFCLHWASHDWSMSWYGENNKVILKQEIPSVKKYWNDISPYFKDERYIKIDGKPLLVIYNCTVFQKESFNEFIAGMRGEAKNSGFPDLYIMLSTNYGHFIDADSWGGDALVEYQPWRLFRSELIRSVMPRGYINPNFRALIKDIREAINKKEYMCNYNCKKYFRSALAAWDNSARKKNSALILYGNTPNFMEEWLKDIIFESKKIHGPEENFIFISSWNEWAEGSHLEPDYKYGYAWLEAVKRAIENSRLESSFE